MFGLSSDFQIGEVHVWRVELTQPEHVIQQFRNTLEQDELFRADRFHFEKDRRAFVVSRGFLREIISRYTNTRPEQLRFSYGPYGKPALDGRLRFNMSHSHNLALIALTEDRELGVDVEYIRADFATGDIARRFFSPVEVEVFNSLAAEHQVAAFFRCWTRKEAFIKATGKGLSQALDGFDVTLGPGEPAALLRVDEDDASRWSLSDLNVRAGYAAALAVEGQLSNIALFSV